MATAVTSPARSAEKGTCVVGGAHAFILRICSIVGLAPLRFKSHANGFIVTVSGPMCIYSYTLVTVLVICTVIGLAAEINVGMEVSVRMSSRMSQVVSTCDVLVVVATAGAGVYGAPNRMRNMLMQLDRVSTVDISLGAQYSKLSERRVCCVLIAVLVSFSILLVDDFCFYAQQASRFDRTWDVVTNYIAFYILWYIVVILELQFAFTALSVRARFRAVNDALAYTAKQLAVPVESYSRKRHVNMFAIRVAPAELGPGATNVSLLVDSLSGPEHAVVMRKTAGEPRLVVPPCEAVRHLAALHGALCEVVHHVDRSYGLPVVVILISTMLHLIVTPYFLIMEIIFSSEPATYGLLVVVILISTMLHLIVTPYFLIMEIIVSTNRIHFLVLQFLWCAMHVLRMFVVVEPCHYTINEGKRTEELVCRLMNYTPSTGVLPSRLELFSRQLMLRSFNYSPLGMCTLDRPLVASVIGAVTTYLVILIQFQR